MSGHFKEINRAEMNDLEFQYDFQTDPLETAAFPDGSGVCKIDLRLDMFHILQILS
jgi:hypothetical protein